MNTIIHIMVAGVVGLVLCTFVALDAHVFAAEPETLDVTVEENSASAAATPSPAAQALQQAQGAAQGAVQAAGRLWTADPVDMMDRMQQDMAALQQRMSSMFDDAFFGTARMSPDQQAGMTAMDEEYSYDESGAEIVLHCPFAGVRPDSLKVDVEGTMVGIRGVQEKKVENTSNDGTGTVQSVSTSRSSFFRAFPMHANADPEGFRVEQDDAEVRVFFKKKSDEGKRVV